MDMYTPQERWDEFSKNLCDFFNVHFESTPVDEQIITDFKEIIPWNKGKKGLQVPWNKGIKTGGHPHSQKSKDKISNALKGKKKSDSHIANLAGIFILTSPDGKTFNIKNLSKFARENNLDQGALSKVAAGKRPNHKGWVCKKSTNDSILS